METRSFVCQRERKRERQRERDNDQIKKQLLKNYDCTEEKKLCFQREREREKHTPYCHPY